MNDLLDQLNQLNATGYFDLVPLARAHGVNLAIDNMGGDSDGVGYALMVVTPQTDPDTSFAGPELGGEFDAPPPRASDVARFLSQHQVQAIVCTADGQAYLPSTYINLLDE
jgi:hypothetical protein